MTPKREKLVELRFDKGMTREGIAEYYGVSIATVRRWIKDLDVPRLSRRAKPKHLTSSGEIIAKVDKGYTVIERAMMKFGGRLVERDGFGYYLDGKPAHTDAIIEALRAEECHKNEPLYLDSHFG